MTDATDIRTIIVPGDGTVSVLPDGSAVLTDRGRQRFTVPAPIVEALAQLKAPTLYPLGRTEERERIRGLFRDALADKKVTWPAEVDELYDRCFSAVQVLDDMNGA